MHHRRLVVSAFATIAAFAAAMAPRDARACGGCFHQPNPGEATVVTDHRMAFALSPTQTILWDQVKYAGNPSEFVWVLPVHPGTRIELSHDAWLAALDATTQPLIKQPPVSYAGGGYGDDMATGCGCSGASAESGSLGGFDGVADAAPPPVTVVSQDVVGPYETVTLRSTDPKALESWLLGHGYEIPASVQPIIDAYTSEGFDFIALRLRPGQGVRAMQPVRVVTPGADPSLPLRMVAAGVGQNVGLTLYVLGEGRYEAQNFPNAVLDETKLVWDYAQSRSNYQDLVTGLMAQAGGRTWVTESSKSPTVFSTGAFSGGGPLLTSSGNPGLADAYFAGCGAYVPPYTFNDLDGSADGSSEAGDDAATDAPSDAPVDAPSDGPGDAATGADAGDGGHPQPDGGACIGACCDFDDLNVAMTGLHSSDVVLTRLRAYLPVDALKVGDLRLVASADQGNVSNVHTANAPSTPTTGAGLAPTRPSKVGTVVTIGAAFFALASMLRRRRR
jgi:Uncharacterized protein conserved in bacteria (DUF2330)